MALMPDLLGVLFPRFTARWLMARRALDQVRKYDAAQPSQWRPVLQNLTSGDGVMDQTGATLRQIARHLDENHDLVVALFDDLCNNIVGAGVKVAPMVRRADGTLAEDINDRAAELWDQWGQAPETTGEMGLEAMERLICRSWLRDGEEFTQLVTQPAYRYRTPVPLVLELLEADLVPFNYSDATTNTLHGIRCDDWNAPLTYYVWKNHPGDPLRPVTTMSDLKVIPAERMIHVKFTRRLRQRRGVPVIHAVLTRLQDLKDYEESERIAAKVAADLTWFIQRTSEYQGIVDVDTATNNRTLKMSAGAGFELLPGETVGTIKSERPNSALVSFRDGMLRAVAGGTGTRFSSIARNYNGTYSAQRQELVEGAIAYRAQFAYLVRRFYRPVYEAWMRQAVLAGALKVPLTGVDKATLYRADFRAPALPWIDPSKEADAYRTLVEAGLESRQEIMRQRGRDPGKVWEEIEEEQASGLFASQVESAGDLAFGSAAETAAEADDTAEAA
jgi:lambda family phage portal protein